MATQPKPEQVASDADAEAQADQQRGLIADRVADPGVAANDAEQGRRALEKAVAGGRQRLVGPLPRTFVLGHVDDGADLGSRGIPVYFVRLRLVESN